MFRFHVWFMRMYRRLVVFNISAMFSSSHETSILFLLNGLFLFTSDEVYDVEERRSFVLPEKKA